MTAKTSKTRAHAAKTRNPKSLKDLRQDPQNARRHTERNLAMIGASLDQVGAGRSIVIDETATILAGNATQRQALERGMKLKVIDADRDTVIAVRRTDLTAEQKTALALYDNRASDLSEWSAEALTAAVRDGADLSDFFSPEELSDICAPAEPGDPENSAPADVAVGQCGVIVLCADESEQQRVFEELQGHGYTCKVVNT